MRWMAFFLMMYCSTGFSITCYYTLAKDNCWTNYDVTVDVIDSRTNKTLTSITAPKGKSWARQTFECEASQKLMYIAQFNPVFWEGDTGKKYNSLNYWSLPDVVKPNEKAWTLSVCYPADFSLVPLPPNNSGNCTCDFTSIPSP